MCIKIIKNIYYKNISVYKGCFLLFFSCGHGGIHGSHDEIESGKNCKPKYVHAHYIKLLALCRSG